MQTLLYLLLGVHGAIHLLGFLHAFQIQEFPAFSQSIAKPWGLLWLLGVVAFGLTIGCRWQGYAYWWVVGLIAVGLSQLLIFTHWQDAKFGTIPNLIILLLVLVGWMNYKLAQQVRQERIQLETQSRTPASWRALDSLPGSVQRWLQWSGADSQEVLRSVQLEQELKMKLKPEQADWAPAVATQFFTVNPPAFNWALDMQMNPLLAVQGRDQFEHGQGGMQMKIWSLIPIVQVQDNPQINEAALQRFLAEIVWFPAAARSSYIEWEALDEQRARATMHYGDTSGSGIFHFDEAGRFRRFTAMRYKDTVADAERREWIAEALEYGQWEGVSIPARLRLTWKLEEGEFTWLELEVKNLQYNPDQLVSPPFG